MRRKKRGTGLGFYFTMAIFGEVCLSILVGVGLILVLNRLFRVTLSIPSVIWVLVASSAVAGIIALECWCAFFVPVDVLAAGYLGREEGA